MSSALLAMPFSSGGELAVLLPPDLLVLESSEGNSVHIMVSLNPKTPKPQKYEICTPETYVEFYFFIIKSVKIRD